GNQADLSQLSTSHQSRNLSLLMDHRLQLINKMASCDRIHIVLDNAGVELFTDLLLVHHLIQSKSVAQVSLHFKQQPIFVSDALIKDFWSLIEFLEGTGCSGFCSDFRRWIEEDSIRLFFHPFWTTPSFYTQLPEDVIPNDTRTVVISKGDANYRRFFEDRDFPYSANFPRLFHHCRYNLFALRTLKSELQTNLDPEKVSEITDHDWMVNGQYAVIQNLKT
ncbi:MAG: ARMT1-like domain-containing protein, partial [Bacteroidota bacterium]